MTNLNQKFLTEQSCLDYLETLRWRGFPVSPFDPLSKVYKCRNGNYRCRNTGKYFNAKTGTMFYNSKIPLLTWFKAIELLSDPISVWNSVSLSKELRLTQKTTWFLIQKVKRYLQIGMRPKAKDSNISTHEVLDNDILDLSGWLKSLR